MNEPPLQSAERWLLPEGIDELLPEQAGQVEGLRRALLDVFHCWGYEFVIPPFIEYLPSLLTGTGGDLELETFKLMDPLSGHLLGIRADMTPQAARIDAHRLRREEPVRLCYFGTVLHTRAEGFTASRAPMQVGAELYGHAGVESDLEILELMLETLHITGLQDYHVDFGHVGIFRALARAAQLNPAAEAHLFDAMQRKAVPEIEAFVSEAGLADSLGRVLKALPRQNGAEEVLEQARELLKAAGVEALAALDELCDRALRFRKRRPDTPLHFDLAELRGYRYHTGMVFAAFTAGHGQEIARGGRYDDIGRYFGRARPATGFSADLKTLVEVSGRPAQARPDDAILAPAVEDQALRAKVAELRRAGERVIQQLPGQNGEAREMDCRRCLQKDGQHWRVKTLD